MNEKDSDMDYGYYWVVRNNCTVPILAWWTGAEWSGCGWRSTDVQEVLGRVPDYQESKPSTIIRQLQEGSYEGEIVIRLPEGYYVGSTPIKNALAEAENGEFLSVYRLVCSGTVKRRPSPLEFAEGAG
jgi:outer membrane lipoprotein-sorting protein